MFGYLFLAFVAILIGSLVIAFTTGRAYWGQAMLYVTRAKHPLLFWLVVGFTTFVLLQAVTFVIAGIQR